MAGWGGGGGGGETQRERERETETERERECLPHVPVQVNLPSQEEVNEAGDVLLWQFGISKTNVIESFEFG